MNLTVSLIKSYNPQFNGYKVKAMPSASVISEPKYSPETIRIIEAKVKEYRRLIEQYPHNNVVKKSLEICLDMLEHAAV